MMNAPKPKGLDLFLDPTVNIFNNDPKKGKILKVKKGFKRVLVLSKYAHHSNHQRLREIADYAIKHFGNLNPQIEGIQERFAELCRKVDNRTNPYARKVEFLLQIPKIPNTINGEPEEFSVCTFTYTCDVMTPWAEVLGALKKRAAKTDLGAIPVSYFHLDQDLVGEEAVPKDAKKLTLLFSRIDWKGLCGFLEKKNYDESFITGKERGRKEGFKATPTAPLESIERVAAQTILELIENAKQRGEREGYNNGLQLGHKQYKSAQAQKQRRLRQAQSRSRYQSSNASSYRNQRAKRTGYSTGTFGTGWAVDSSSSDSPCRGGGFGGGGFGGGCSSSDSDSS